MAPFPCWGAPVDPIGRTPDDRDPTIEEEARRFIGRERARDCPRTADDSAIRVGLGFDSCLASPGAPDGIDAAGPPIAELAVSWGEGGLIRTMDGKPTPLAAYLAALPVVIWSNREDEILAGVPERRRRMIDAGLIAERPERVAILARHRRVLAQKRELLRRRQSGLEAWNRLLAEAGRRSSARGPTGWRNPTR